MGTNIFQNCVPANRLKKSSPEGLPNKGYPQRSKDQGPLTKTRISKDTFPTSLDMSLIWGRADPMGAPQAAQAFEAQGYYIKVNRLVSPSAVDSPHSRGPQLLYNELNLLCSMIFDLLRNTKLKVCPRNDQGGYFLFGVVCWGQACHFGSGQTQASLRACPRSPRARAGPI
jgi:hypothetical protein